ncbi:MAG TPA: PfkB family carbohydrate kinase, partial [Anaeromyxobacteraceae bacterium]|nr:PfkB family carbohydrate kinase [Anaeromyxobacteraceae bacterium]
MAAAILVCGHVTLDRHGDALLPGGSAYYAGHAYRALGARCAVATCAGPELPAEALAGLEADVAPAPATTRFVNAYAPDGARTQRLEAVAPPLDPARIPPAWRTPDLLHLAPVIAEADVRAFVSAVRARVVGLGVQGNVRARAPDGTVVQPPWRWEPGALSGVGVACVGEDDLRGQGDLLDRLVAEIPIVAFTHGERGCEVIVRGRTSRVGVHPAREVDPTGAGDVFAAGFLLGLARGAEPVEAARLGAAAASIVVEARAGDALP